MTNGRTNGPTDKAFLGVGYSGRRKAPTPCMKVFKALVREELRQKFKGNGDIRNSKSPEDTKALQWLKVEMGWTLPAMNGNTLINLNPWRNKTT